MTEPINLDQHRICPGTTEHNCDVSLAGEPRNRKRCHRCASDYQNEARRARAAGLPFGVPDDQLELPIPWHNGRVVTDPAEQRSFS